MPQIAYVLLCHDDPQAVVRQVRGLLRGGDRVAVHYDGAAPKAEFERLKAALSELSGVAFPKVRTPCPGGSLPMRAILATLRAARDAFDGATHFQLLSGACMPVKSAEYIHARLAAEDVDRIEMPDARFDPAPLRDGFLPDGRFWRPGFLAGWGRPRGEAASDGGAAGRTAWWCLRRATVDAVLSQGPPRAHSPGSPVSEAGIMRSLVAQCVPDAEISGRAPTFEVFADHGAPMAFHDDHHDFLLAQDRFFARVISPQALQLRARLDALYLAKGATFDVEDDGAAQIRAAVTLGRSGRRFGRRFWERDWVGEVTVVVCGARDVAHRLADRLRAETDAPVLGYVFDPPDVPLPDLGGAERGLEKRRAHAPALVRLLSDHFASTRIVLFLEPGNAAILQVFREARMAVRVLEVDCAGPCARDGVRGTDAGDDLARFPGGRLRAGDGLEVWAEAVASAFALPRARARAIAAGADLFAE